MGAQTENIWQPNLLAYRSPVIQIVRLANCSPHPRSLLLFRGSRERNNNCREMTDLSLLLLTAPCQGARRRPRARWARKVRLPFVGALRCVARECTLFGLGAVRGDTGTFEKHLLVLTPACYLQFFFFPAYVIGGASLDQYSKQGHSRPRWNSDGPVAYSTTP